MTSAAAGWAAATASVRGASHERSGKPNQDAVRVLEVAGPTPGLVAAVCDGHGGDRYVRSDVGSRLGVEVACSVGRRALETLGPSPSAAVAESHLAGEVARSIVDHWRRRVLDDVEQHPFSTEEQERAGGPLGSDPLIAYGCTLLLAVVAPSWVGLLQIGDGDATVVRGTSAASPVPGDDRLVGGETTSLCLPTAAADARIAVLGTPLPDMIILTSDGYANSFASPTWRSEVGVDLRDHVRRIGIDGVEERLPSWLADSAVAAGDDVSMALIHRIASSTSPASAYVEPFAEPSARRGGPWRTVSLVGVAALLGVGAGWLVADATDSGPAQSSDGAIAVTATTTTTVQPIVSSTVPTVTVSITTTTSEPDSSTTAETNVATLGAEDQVYFFVGDTEGVVLAIDPNSPTAPNARSFGWVTVSNRDDNLDPQRWESAFGTLFFQKEIKGKALAVHQEPQYVWVVGPDRMTLTAYDAVTGDCKGQSKISDIGGTTAVEGTAQSSPSTATEPDSNPCSTTTTSTTTTTVPTGVPSTTEKR